jgi:hypothetical protein
MRSDEEKREGYSVSSPTRPWVRSIVSGYEPFVPENAMQDVGKIGGVESYGDVDVVSGGGGDVGAAEVGADAMSISDLDASGGLGSDEDRSGQDLSMQELIGDEDREENEEEAEEEDEDPHVGDA